MNIRDIHSKLKVADENDNHDILSRKVYPGDVVVFSTAFNNN